MTYTDKSKTVAFSGHRELRPAPADLFCVGEPADSTGFGEFIRGLTREAVRKLYAEGYSVFLCGMAQGFDLLAGEVVLDLREELPRLELIAAIPHPGQSYWFNAETKAMYERILTGTTQSVTICDSYRPDCFHRRNDYLIDNSSALLCFYNGSKGGTEYTVRRAVKEGLKIVNLA